MMRRTLFHSLFLLLFACSTTGNGADQSIGSVDKKGIPAAANDPQNEPRTVAIGDVHGDYDQFVRLLRGVGLVDKRGKWSGGDSRLVQLGDIPDRGPDSRKAMDLLMKLEKEAKKAGGKVIALIGNHESMMLTDDLRYVHPGEYEAFKDRDSRKRRDAYYRSVVAHLKKTLPEEEMPVFDKAYRAEWNKKYPLGYVEHRLAWAPTGKYGKWVLSHPVAAKLANTIFVHGGFSAEYAGMPLSDLNTRVRTELIENDLTAENAIIDDANGPLWHRSWTTLAETPENEAALDAVLAQLGVERMVVAHTPLVPIVLPRFGGKLVMVDVGMSAAYGRGYGALELVGSEAFAIFEGGRLPLPNQSGIDAVLAYLDEAEKIIGPQAKIENYRVHLTTPPAVEQPAAEAVNQ